ncbi:hypothetical protein E4U55_000396 [Claviceps digitariae]|nr:hypothetical protein E4U55_000396 [Claviceps digitariae]
MIKSLLFTLTFSFIGLVSGDTLPLSHRKPTVRVKNGTYQGVYSPGYDQDLFLGMPYAKKAQRFTPSQHLDEAWHTVRLAQSYPPHCPGYGPDSTGFNMSEDCLHLNVVRPHGVARDAKLPVAVWIHGGGLTMGGSADPRYNLSFMVEHSVRINKPIIGVSFNYRLSAFGFLGSKEARDAGATNIGFRDQRLALHWVNENIEAFGGSPDKVTIWGQSAGAESVAAQILAYNGQHGGLFRAAIGQSGFGISLTLPGGFNATAQHQTNFDSIVRSIPSCASLVNSPAALDCLGSVDFQQLYTSIAKLPMRSWPPVLDGTFLVDYTARQLANGHFARVPLLVGSNSDELAVAGLEDRNVVQTDDDFREAIRGVISPTAADNMQKPIDDIVNEALLIYPDIQSRGVPSLTTWPHVIRAGDEYAEQLGLQFRRFTAFYGDMIIGFIRRRANLAWSRYGVPSFTYRFDVSTNSVPGTFGAVHFEEVAFVFHNIHGDGYTPNPFGGNNTQYTERALALSSTMCTQWINFIADLNPNGHDDEAATLAHTTTLWPRFRAEDGGGAGRGLVFSLDGPAVEWDDVRAEGIAWWIENDLGLVGN